MELRLRFHWYKEDFDLSLLLFFFVVVLLFLLSLFFLEEIEVTSLDANKDGYDGYYEAALQLVRVGGVVAVDNMLWYGKVADTANSEASTQTLRQLNDKMAVRNESFLERICHLVLLGRSPHQF